MRQKFWKTQKFKSLQELWEKKLKESGFKDVEYSETRLKQRAANSYRTSIQVAIENKLRYYEIMGQLFHEEEFKTETERLIMSRRASGIPVRLICRELKECGMKPKNPTCVNQIIWYYEKKWRTKKSNP